MIEIKIKDNQIQGIELKETITKNDTIVNDSIIKNIVHQLRDISKIPISELLQKNYKDFFIFTNEDKIEDKNIFTLSNTKEPNECKIHTGNIAGFIEYNDLQIDITSRFTEDEEDFFLHYMLLKVFNINLTDYTHSKEKDKLFDFLMFLFPHFLNNAFNNGIFRKYERFSYNNPNIKGVINTARFIKQDIPFMGNIAYDTREFTTDNILTQLVRHTIEFIKSTRYKSMLNSVSITKQVKAIIEATPSYKKSQRQLIINKNLKPQRHPYYSKWTDLQRICIAILQHQKIKYEGLNDDKIHGILFDVSWLWEEYLNTLLKEKGFIHPRNKTKENPIYLFKDESGDSGKRYPDFYKDYYVLDAKYKRFENKNSVSDIDRDDIHQMISYMHCLYKGEYKDNSMHGIFLYPFKAGTERLNPKTLKGYGGAIKAEGFKIPQGCRTFEEFSNQMEEKSKNFIDRVCPIDNYKP